MTGTSCDGGSRAVCRLFPSPSLRLSPPFPQREFSQRPRRQPVLCPAEPGAAAAPPCTTGRGLSDAGELRTRHPRCAAPAVRPTRVYCPYPGVGGRSAATTDSHPAPPGRSGGTLRGCRGGHGGPASCGVPRGAGRSPAPQPAFPAHLRHIGTIGLRNSAAPSARMGPLSQWQPPAPAGAGRGGSGGAGGTRIGRGGGAGTPPRAASRPAAPA